jgi:hypothetical protein
MRDRLDVGSSEKWLWMILCNRAFEDKNGNETQMEQISNGNFSR